MLKLLHAPSLEASQCIDTLATKLGPSASPLLTFYCAGRRMHFGERAQSEIRQLQAACQTADIFGALTLGEISTDAQMGFPEFHNAALVCAGPEITIPGSQKIKAGAPGEADRLFLL